MVKVVGSKSGMLSISQLDKHWWIEPDKPLNAEEIAIFAERDPRIQASRKRKGNTEDTSTKCESRHDNPPPPSRKKAPRKMTRQQREIEEKEQLKASMAMMRTQLDRMESSQSAQSAIQRSEFHPTASGHLHSAGGMQMQQAPYQSSPYFPPPAPYYSQSNIHTSIQQQHTYLPPPASMPQIMPQYAQNPSSYGSSYSGHMDQNSMQNNAWNPQQYPRRQ